MVPAAASLAQNKPSEVTKPIINSGTVAARVAAESESLRNTLLASISHDLRTPLAVLAAAGSTLAEHDTGLDAATRTSLARSIESSAREMSELVSNVLDLTRFVGRLTREIRVGNRDAERPRG